MPFSCSCDKEMKKKENGQTNPIIEWSMERGHVQVQKGKGDGAAAAVSDFFLDLPCTNHYLFGEGTKFCKFTSKFSREGRQEQEEPASDEKVQLTLRSSSS